VREYEKNSKKSAAAGGCPAAAQENG